jgi:hypothetical protein
MRVRVKEGCSVGIGGDFFPSRAELDLPVKVVVEHQANLEPADASAEAFFAAMQGEQA